MSDDIAHHFYCCKILKQVGWLNESKSAANTFLYILDFVNVCLRKVPKKISNEILLF